MHESVSDVVVLAVWFLMSNDNFLPVTKKMCVRLFLYFSCEVLKNRKLKIFPSMFFCRLETLR